MTLEEMIAEGDRLYERAKMLPESDRSAFIAMVDLRNLWPKVSLEISEMLQQLSTTPRSAGDTTPARSKPPRD